MRKYIIITFLLVAIFDLKAQSLEIKEPGIIIPSPDAAALGKYGQYPVSLSTGLVQIDVPIYNIELPMISIPISISYHASGIKVDDISSVVGLGWSLNAGGVINRSVRGMPDPSLGSTSDLYAVNDLLKKCSTKFISGMGRDSRLEWLSSFYKGTQNSYADTETDLYIYNAAGLSGSFRLDTDGKLMQIPLTNNKITFIENDSFEIISSNGTIYTFQDKEIAEQKAQVLKHTTSWYLSEIRMPDGKSIQFNYTLDTTPYVDYYFSTNLTIDHNTDAPSGAAPFPSVSQSTSVQYSRTVNTQLLTSIEFSGGKIYFDYKSDRSDRRKNRLVKIRINNNKNQQIKSFSFQQSYFSGRLNFNKLNILDSQNNETASYQFEYNTKSNLPPYCSINGANDSYLGQDLWGYYNGVTTNTHSLDYKTISITPISQTSANRSVNEEYAKANILTKITYPTGGYTEFEYEGNRGLSNELLGGLRVKQVRSYTLDEPTPIIKTYEYEQIASNINADYLNPMGYSQGIVLQSTDTPFPAGMTKKCDYYSSEPILPLGKSGAAPVFYGKITEYDGFDNDSNGKTIHYYSFLAANNDIKGYNLLHCILPKGSSGSSEFIPRLKNYYIDQGWKRGQPNSIEVYKKKDKTFILTKSTTYKYDILRKTEFRIGFNAFANFLDINGNPNYSPYTPFQYEATAKAEDLFQYADMVGETGLYKLIETKEKIFFDDNKSIETTTTNSYDRLDNQYEVTAINQINSDGIARKKTFQYSTDLKNMANGIYRYMSEQKNMISPILEQSDYESNTFIKSAQIIHKRFIVNNVEIVVPYLRTTKKDQNPDDIEITINQYDNKGNILEILKRDDTKNSFIWGYQQSYVIAKIENIGYNNVLSNTTLIDKINQLENYSILTDTSVRLELKSLNDAIRNNLPANVFITTYTYQPLIGITSITEPNGLTTYYDYDNNCRLKETYILEGDKKKKIQEYEYYYQK